MQWRRGVWFAVIVCSFFLRQSVAEELKTPVHLRAEYLDYDKNSGLIYASGHATVTSENMVLEADEIFYNVDEETVLARGHVSGTDAAQDFSGHELVYNLKTKIGELSFGKIYSYKWYISGPRMERHGTKKMYLPKGYFTTCDLEYPHYSIRAKKISVFPKKYVVCYNALLYVGDTPLFYLPVFYQSLRKKRYSLSVYAGHNSTEGDFVKVIFGYPLTEHTYGRLYLDQMEYLGLGKGFRYEYDFPDRMNGSLFYYYIHQKERRISNQDPLAQPDVPEAKRWQTTFSHWQRFDPTWIGQADVKILSDQSFNRRFSEEEWRKINNDIISFAALSKLEKNYSLRLVGERRDLWQPDPADPNNGDYKPLFVYAPRVSFTTNQIRLPWSYSQRMPLYFSFNLDTKRIYTKEQGYYLWDGNSQIALINRLNLSRSMSLTPRAGFTQYWQDRISLTNTRNVLQTHYFTNLNLRTRVTNFMDWDIGHTYTEEKWARPLEPKGVVQNRANTAIELRFSRIERQAKEVVPEIREYPWHLRQKRNFAEPVTIVSLSLLPSGIGPFRKVFNEKSLLLKYVDPRRVQGISRRQLLRFRSSIEYNLIHNGYFPVLREERFTNLVNNLSITPLNGFSVTVVEELKVERHRLKEGNGNEQPVYTSRIFTNQRINAEAALVRQLWDAKVIVNYLKTDRGKLDLQHDTGVRLTKNLKLNLRARYSLKNERWRILSTHMIERGAYLYRDLHCWELIFSWNKYAQEEEAWIRLNLKAFPERKIGVYHSQRKTNTMIEEEWNIRRQ